MEKPASALMVRMSVLSPSLFFFSSRRRHTRCLSDWSSDVCSSDLSPEALAPPGQRLRACLRLLLARIGSFDSFGRHDCSPRGPQPLCRRSAPARSEERRVGKESRSGWWRVDDEERAIENRVEAYAM